MAKKHYTQLYKNLYLRIKLTEKYPEHYRFYFEVALVIRHQGLDKLSKTLPLVDLSVGRRATLGALQLWERPDPCPPYPLHHDWHGGDVYDEAIDAAYKRICSTLDSHWRGNPEPWTPAGQALEDATYIKPKIKVVLDTWKSAIKKTPVTETHFPFPLI